MNVNNCLFNLLSLIYLIISLFTHTYAYFHTHTHTHTHTYIYIYIYIHLYKHTPTNCTYKFIYLLIHKFINIATEPSDGKSSLCSRCMRECKATSSESSLVAIGQHCHLKKSPQNARNNSDIRQWHMDNHYKTELVNC